MLTYMLSGRSLCGRPTAFETPRHLSLFYSPPLKKAAHSFPGCFLYAKYQHIPQKYFMESVLAPHDGIIIARPEIRAAFVMTFQIPRRDVLFPQHGAGKFIIFFVVLAVHTCFTAILHARLPPLPMMREKGLACASPFAFIPLWTTMRRPSSRSATGPPHPRQGCRQWSDPRAHPDRRPPPHRPTD